MKTGGQKGGTVPAHDLAELRDDVGGEHRVALLAVVSVAAVVLAFAVAVPGRALLAAIQLRPRALRGAGLSTVAAEDRIIEKGVATATHRVANRLGFADDDISGGATLAAELGIVHEDVAALLTGLLRALVEVNLAIPGGHGEEVRHY